MANKPDSLQEFEKLQQELSENSTIFSDTESEEPKKNKNKNKSKSRTNPYTKLLCVMIAAAIVLGGSIFAVKQLWILPQGESGGEDNTETIYLTADAEIALDDMENAAENAVSNILSITIDRSNESYEIVPDKSDDEVFYKLNGYDDMPMNTNTSGSVYDMIFTVEAESRLDGEWTLSDCGLDEPALTVTVKMADNSEFTIKFGDQLPDNSSSRYVTTSLKDGIYIVSDDYFDSFDLSVLDYVDLTIVSAIESTGDDDPYFSSGELSRFESISYSGTKFKKNIDLIYDQNSVDALVYKLTSPTSTYADDEAISEVLTPVSSGFSAYGAYCLDPTAADYKKYGLENPYITIKYVIKGTTYVLRFSEAGAFEEGYYACTVNDVPVIYKVACDTYDFIEYTADDIRNTVLFAKNIDTVHYLTAEYGDTKVTYEITYSEVIENEEETTSSGEDTTVTTSEEESEYQLEVFCNNQVVVAEDFQRIYQELVMVNAVGHIDDDSEVIGEPTLKLTLEFHDGNVDILTFTKHGRYYSYRINGIGDVLVQSKTVESLIQHFDDLQAGKTIPEPYK